MSTDVTNRTRPVALDDGTVYADLGDPHGLGRVLDDADLISGGTMRQLVLCGPTPGDSSRVLRGWVDRLGSWVVEADPYIGPSSLRLRVGRDGRAVTVTRAAGWFGDAGPEVVAEATKHVRHAVGKCGARMVGSPSTTGLAMLRAYWDRQGYAFDPAPADVQTLIRSTSGQGRFELLPRGRERGGRRLVAVDARFQYAAIAGSIELGVGEPVDIGPHDPPPYAAAWVEVEVEAGDGCPPFGLLGVKDPHGRGWSYPARGRFVTWCHWCEVELARANGYRVTVRRAIVWRSRSRALRGWASAMVRERDRLDGRTAIAEPVRAAVAAAYRNLTIQTIGQLHGRDTRREYVVADAAEIPADAEGWTRVEHGWRYVVAEPAAHRAAWSHPEWTSHLWAVARVRLARQMLACKPAELVAVALDSTYVTRPPAEPDDGRVGGWRVTAEAGPWQAFGSMTDVYRHIKGE